jgi:glycosyltransferase involved in cell wall biosynthesis
MTPTLPPDFATAPPDGRRRVGITVSNFGYGGIEFWSRKLAPAIEAAGWQVTGIVAGTADHAEPSVVEWFRSRWPVGAGRKAIRALASDCDVLICSGLPQARTWLGDLLQAGPRIVLVSHGSCDWTRQAMSWGNLAAVCVGVSEAAAEQFPEGTAPRVIWNVPHAEPPRLSRAQQRRAWGVPEEARVYGYLGRWAPEKRPDLLRFAQEYLPGWHFVAVGPYQNRVPARSRLSALPMHFVGPTDDPGSALGAFDCVCLPSRTEGFALVATEAWTYGVPLIATPVGSVREVPHLARIVPVNAGPREWAEAIEADAADPDRDARVIRGRVFAASHLTPERFNRDWQALLAPLLSDSPVPAGA